MAAGGREPVISRLLQSGTKPIVPIVDLLSLSNEPSRSNCHIDRVSVIVCTCIINNAGEVSYNLIHDHFRIILVY